jgi:hypothetical protein
MVLTVTALNIAIQYLINDYYDHLTISKFHDDLYRLKDDIKTFISEDLHEKFETEFQCVYYETEYGDGEYTHCVVEDCMNVLLEIIDVLYEIENKE